MGLTARGVDQLAGPTECGCREAMLELLPKNQPHSPLDFGTSTTSAARDGDSPGRCCTGGLRGGLFGESPAGAQHMLGHPQGVGGKSGAAQLRNRLVDVVLDPPQLHLSILDDGIRSARVAVPGLADTSRVHDLDPGKPQVEGKVRMPDTEKIGRQVGTAQLPGLRILAEVFVERIAGGRMHEGEPEPIEFDGRLDGKSGEITELSGIELAPLDRPGRRHQLPESGPLPGSDPMGDVVVVVATHRRTRMLLNPVQTGSGIDSVVDQVTGEQAGVKWFANGLQGRPVGVDIGQDQNAQGEWPGDGSGRAAGVYKNEAWSLTLPGGIISNNECVATANPCGKAPGMSEQALEDQSLRERLGHAEQLLRELSEHLAQSFLPQLRRAMELVDSKAAEEQEEVADSTVRSAMAAVLKSDDFSQQLINSLDPYLRSIQKEVEQIRDGG